MISKAERNGAVMAADLETPETDQPVMTRRKTSETDADRLTTLLARIEAARTLHPQGKDLHCEDCFNRGRNAAIRLIEGER